MREAGRAFGVELVEASSGGVSDANLIADAGMPVIDSLGPVGGNAHSDAEYLEVKSMVPEAAVAAWAFTRGLQQPVARPATDGLTGRLPGGGPMRRHASDEKPPATGRGRLFSFNK